MSLCALCGEEKPLCESHIIPNFIAKWLKESSATGYIRLREEPNLRVQDIYKTPILCNECEQLFSTFEKKFSENIFIPFHKGETTFRYEEWLQLFSISLAWRVIEVCKNNSCYSDIYDELYDHHILFNYPWVQDIPGVNIPEKFNWYHLRSIDLTIATSKSGTIFTYVQIAGIIICSLISPPNNPDWENTIILNKGVIDTKSSRQPPERFVDFYIDRSKFALDWQINEKQQENVKKSMIKNIERLEKSHSLQVHQYERKRREESS
jgi:hypothetical protein